MSTSLHLMLVWGLSSRLLDGGGMPRLQNRAQHAERARLHCSFPNVPATVEASILTGTSPTAHGVLGSESFDRVGKPVAPLPPDVLRIIRETSLLRPLAAHGPGSPQELAAARVLDERLGALLDSSGQDRVMLCGGPVALRVQRRVALEEILAQEKASDAHRWQWLMEGAIARLRCPAEAAGRVKQRLLRTPGVERILEGEGLMSWGAHHAEAGDVLVLAEANTSFEDGGGAFGHPESEDTAPLLAWGASPGWPEEVHDVRIAPTLCAAAGAARGGPFEDTPLPW